MRRGRALAMVAVASVLALASLVQPMPQADGLLWRVAGRPVDAIGHLQQHWQRLSRDCTGVTVWPAGSPRWREVQSVLAGYSPPASAGAAPVQVLGWTSAANAAASAANGAANGAATRADPGAAAGASTRAAAQAAPANAATRAPGAAGPSGPSAPAGLPAAPAAAGTEWLLVEVAWPPEQQGQTAPNWPLGPQAQAGPAGLPGRPGALDPAIVPMVRDGQGLRVLAEGVWSGDSGPWLAPVFIRRFLALRVPAMPAPLRQCLEPRLPAFAG